MTVRYFILKYRMPLDPRWLLLSSSLGYLSGTECRKHDSRRLLTYRGLKKNKTVSDSVWAFQNWVKIRHLERQVKSLRSKLGEHGPSSTNSDRIRGSVK